MDKCESNFGLKYSMYRIQPGEQLVNMGSAVVSPSSNARRKRVSSSVPSSRMVRSAAKLVSKTESNPSRRSAATIQSYLTLCGETLRTVLELLDPGSARNFQSEPAPESAPEPDAKPVAGDTWSSVAGNESSEDERPRMGRIPVHVGGPETCYSSIDWYWSDC